MGLVLPTDAKAYCQELFEFHKWRQEKITTLLQEVDQTIFSQQLDGSFGSLYIILNHLVWAEKVWLGRVDNDELATMRSTDVAGLLDDWGTVTQKWSQMVRQQDAEFFSKTIRYFNTNGDAFENSLAEIIVHLVDHSTYHIGQMMNAVRGFGIEPVSTNYIHYLRATSQAS